MGIKIKYRVTTEVGLQEFSDEQKAQEYHELNAGSTIETIEYSLIVFPELEELKAEKIAYLTEKTRKKIQETQYLTLGNMCYGKYFTLENQMRCAIGSVGFDTSPAPSFKAALKNCLTANMAELDDMVLQITHMTYEGLTDDEKLEMLENLNGMDVS